MTIFSQQSYLQKHRALPKQIATPPPSDLGIVVVIPSHAEPDLISTLESLDACAQPPCSVEILIILNAGEHHPEEVHELNDQTEAQFHAWSANKRVYPYFLIRQDQLRRKHAGVGLARKIGFDEAVDRLEQAGQEDGLLVGLDADSRVAPNYLQSLWQWFLTRPKEQAVSLYFEHPIGGGEFPSEIYRGIAQYELYLRHYVQGLRWAKYPLAYHCVGSSMAVRSTAYQAQNGMNRRKAGEDYYFLHKYMLLDTLGEWFGTTVYPSPRPSQRVPFGTGRAISDWLQGEQGAWQTFHRQSFEELKQLLEKVDQFRTQELVDDLGPAMQAYLTLQNLSAALPDIRQHSKTPESFYRRFIRWFDGLKTLQFMHFARDNYYANQPLLEEANYLFKLVHPQVKKPHELVPMLMAYRQWERGQRS